MFKLMQRIWIGASGNTGDAATLIFPLGLKATYYDYGKWGTVYFGRFARINWRWEKQILNRRPAAHEVYLTVNSTPWGVPKMFGRVIYVGKVGKHLRVFPNAEKYAQWRYQRSYAGMRGPESE